MKYIYQGIICLLCCCFFSNCSNRQQQVVHDDHVHEAESGHDHATESDTHDHDHETQVAAGAADDLHAGEIGFSDELAEAVDLQTMRLEPADFTQVIKTSGRILAAQGEETAVVATVPGVITLGSLPFIDGQAVRKGQSILSIASGGLPDGNVAARTLYTYETAKKEYKRMQQLVGDRIVSAKEFEQARLAYENAKMAWDAIAGKETAAGVAVVSPIGGFLKNLKVSEGDYVTPGQPLAVIAQNSRLRLQADLSEKYFEYLPAIRSAHFITPYDNRVYKLDELQGRIITYGKSTDTESFYIPVTFEFDNRGSVIPGSYVEIYLLTAVIPNTLAVPVSALIEEQGVYSVFVKIEPEVYRKAPVVTGANNGAEVQILRGLSAGEEVVTQGAYQIRLASASNAIPEHNHAH